MPDSASSARTRAFGLDVTTPELSGAAEVFATAAALTNMPMVVTDSALADNPIAWLNPAFCDLTGYEAAEVLGRNCRMLQGPDTDRETVARLREAVRAGTPVAVEILNYRRDGTGFWNALFVTPIARPEGPPRYFVASQLDVTRRYEAERALAQARRLEGLGVLAGGIAHEFNNLLTVIQGNIEPLQEGATDPRTLRRLSRMAEAAERAAYLTRSMVSFARRQRLQDTPLMLNAMLEAAAEELRQALGPDIALRLDLGPLPGAVLADAAQLRTALVNIVTNAREAMAAGGTVVLRTRARLDSAGQPLDVVLSVEDSGSGMTPDVAGRALEPFFTTKPPGGGAGLGLSMAYGFMKQSGGRLELSSRPGQGTTVRLMFPASPAKRPGEPPALPRARAGELVLVLDHDPDLRMQAVSMLRDLGYQAESIADRDAMRDRLRVPQAPDLVLTDPAQAESLASVLPPSLMGRRLLVGGAGVKRPYDLIGLARAVRDRLDNAGG